MEEKHKSRVLSEFRQAASRKEMHVLDIPDDFKFMDPELVELLHDKCAPILLDGHNNSDRA